MEISTCSLNFNKLKVNNYNYILAYVKHIILHTLHTEGKHRLSHRALNLSSSIYTSILCHPNPCISAYPDLQDSYFANSLNSFLLPTISPQYYWQYQYIVLQYTYIVIIICSNNNSNHEINFAIYFYPQTLY